MIEKSNDEMREKNNNLLIQKDLLENDTINLKAAVENEKNSNTLLASRVNELESNIYEIS